jgi:starvation-inducible DNA-binding protein
MKANKQLSENLQAVLVDLIELHIQGKQAHWNVVGINFRDTHFILDEIVDTAEVVSLITERLDAAAETCRRVHDEVDEADPTTADILHKLIETLEQCAWMVSAKSLKPRKRNATTGR